MKSDRREKIMEDTKTKTRANYIRKKLAARHAPGSALRETLDQLTDQQLVSLDDRETAMKIEKLRKERKA
jgi:hypothetical protein